MNIFKSIVRVVGARLLDFAKDEDKADASLVLGTPEDETISGWSGANEKTNPAADAVAKTLDAVHFAGDPRHAEDAAKEDEAVIAAREKYDATKPKS
jgi:hypothetical protein